MGGSGPNSGPTVFLSESLQTGDAISDLICPRLVPMKESNHPPYDSGECIRAVRDLFVGRVVKLGLPHVDDDNQARRLDSLGEGNFNWCEMQDLGLSQYEVGSAVLDYCRKTPSSRAFVFFAMEDQLIQLLLESLASDGDVAVIYAADIRLTHTGALNLIELCYGDKHFFSERIREKMTRERFVFSTRAFIVVYEMTAGIDRITALKAGLRQQLPTATFERRIHGTDEIEDTSYLVEAITNPNSLNLLNRVRLSRNDRLISEFPNSLRGNPGVCVDGSATMELYGLRKSRDLDLICLDKLRSEVLSLGFDVNNDHYAPLPLSHQDVITSPYLHVNLYGIKFTSLAVRQLVLSFGRRSAQAPWTQKKTRDFRLISEYFSERASNHISVDKAVATLATQIRLWFEFAVNRIMPKLPPRLAESIRKVRRGLSLGRR